MAHLDNSSSSSTALRLTFLGLLVVALFVALFARLWFLQVLASDRYAELAERNRVRFVMTEAPRGRILDRHGEEIVKNRPALTVSGDPRRLLNAAGDPRDVEAGIVLDRLSQLLEMSHDDIVERLTSRRYSPFRAVPIKEDVPPEVVFTIKEQQELFPGVVAETLPVRTYPLGEAGAHMLGYIGEITEDQLDEEEFRDYRPGDLVGKAGLERTYERWLQGKPGWQKLEVNAGGIVLDELSRQHPEAGANLRTTIDADLQMETERLLEEGLAAARLLVRSDRQPVPAPAGAVVVVDVRDGGIVAMSSFPRYNPQVFLGGVSTEDWAWLNDDDNHRPLLNRAVVAAHPPGSTFKPITSAAGMAGGVVGPTSTLPCPGSITIGRRWRNWNPRNEGPMDTPRALMRSCDPYYYVVGHSLWERDERRIKEGGEPLEYVEKFARLHGMGRKLGLDLPEERTGFVGGRAWKHEFVTALGQDCDGPEPAWECTWRYYDAINQSIGQGVVTATPLQLAMAYATTANGGTLYRPHIGLEVVSPDGEVLDRIEPEVLDELELEPSHLAAIQRGLEMVVMEPRGTARGAFTGFPLDSIPVAGKTGTAEADGKVPFAWFAAYAPADEPRYAVAVMLEQGSGGSAGAAPVARRVLEAAFGLDITPYPALERMATGE